MIERIIYDNKEYAIVIRADHNEEGIDFLTDPAYSQQLAYMHHKDDKIIDAHYHNKVKRSVFMTQEVLVIRKGVLRVDFYNDDNAYIESVLLNEGDIILLISGGHGFKVIKEVEMVEVKQGPYLGDEDKTRFKGISDQEVVLRKNQYV